MNIYITAQTYNSLGWHPTVSLVAQYFMQNEVDFGSALKEIHLTFYFSSDEEAGSNFGELVATFRARRAQLPKVTFRRKNCSASIEVASEILKTEVWGGKQALSATVFRAAALETIAALKLLAPRIKPSDDLDFEALLTHFENTVQHVPQTDDALASLAVKLLADKQRRIDNANPWDLLAVDFSIFHPQARTVLDDPFFWKGDDDFAPHGNDTGADLLVAYRKWLKKNKDKNSLAFYYALPPQWGFGNAPKNETEATVFDQAAVALAFAELKLRGCCGTIVTELANAALLRQRVEAEAASGWQHQDERLKKLSLLANTLNAARAP